MPRLIEVQQGQEPSAIEDIAVGDVLFFSASGGYVRPGVEVVELLGAFTTAVVGTEGQVFEPVGPPNTVLFRALHAGEAEITIMTGDPFYVSKMTEWHIKVRP